MSLPDGFEKWNPAMRGAFKKGMQAQKDGAQKEACPYKDKRKPDGRLSWSRSFMAAWRDGWEWAASGKP
jgi:ribosome modulation factor